MTYEIIESQVEFVSGDKNTPLTIKRFQDIPQDFLDALKAERAESTQSRAKDLHRVARIPAAVHELWLARDQYDCTKEPVRDSIAKLKAEGLDYFIATDKRL